MTRIRTLEFLPEIFQTETNQQFLAATLDQLVNPPLVQKVQGFVGSRFGYGINANDYYVTEPTKVRTDYQLEPGVVFTKKDVSTAKDFISYPGILDAIKQAGGITDNNNRLFESQFYSWDSFTNLDKIINFNQYYWLPEGPPSVTVASSTVFTNEDYLVISQPNTYNIRVLGSTQGTDNPTLTFIRGGTYNFYVNQDSQFWIQGEPGVDGFSPTQKNLYTRDVFGVTNNGATNGIVSFTVPSSDAQNEFNFPGNNPVGVVSTYPFNEQSNPNAPYINGIKVSDLISKFGGIDGVTSLDGVTVMFYNTGISNEIGYVGQFYDQSNFDTNNGFVANATITINGTDASGYVITTSTANLKVGDSITFTGIPFGNLTPYSTTAPNTIFYISEILSSNTFTITLGRPDQVGNLVPGRKYSIFNINSTNWTQVGAVEVNAGSFVIGKSYVISSVGSTDFTVIGAVNNNVGTVFTATGTGTGTGKAYLQRFTASNTGVLTGSDLIAGTKYLIKTLGNTDWTSIGATSVNAADFAPFNSYVITSLGDTDWNAVANTTGVIYNVGDIIHTSISGTVSQPGTTGTALLQSFIATGADVGSTGSVYAGTGTAIPDAEQTTASGTMTANINQGLYEEGAYYNVNDYFFTINYIGDPLDPVIQLTPAGTIPTEQKIIPTYGTEYINLPFYKNSLGFIAQVPYITAPLTTLYYQDSENRNKVGIIKIIDSNEQNTLDVETDILGKTQFTSETGVVFTNGLKVQFDGDVIPSSYLTGEYYVEGVGTAIELIPVENLVVPEKFTRNIYTTYDAAPYDTVPYDTALYIPIDQDYITISRNALNRNAWSRSNRWFHIDVINATADYNNDPEIANLATIDNKAKRPIIEFYPNLRMFGAGTIGKAPIDFIDFRATDAFSEVAGQLVYYPDVQVYSKSTATLNGIGATFVGSIVGTTLTVHSVSQGALTEEGVIEGQGIVEQTTVVNQVSGQAGSASAVRTMSVTSASGEESLTLTSVVDVQVGQLVSGNGVLLSGIEPSTYVTNIIGNVVYLSQPLTGNVLNGTSVYFYTPGLTGTYTVSEAPPVGITPTDMTCGVYSTTITVAADDVVGPINTNQYINDNLMLLPINSLITGITGTTTLTITVEWNTPTNFATANNINFVANDLQNGNYSLFAGARIVFANDAIEAVRSKIFEVSFSTVAVGTKPVITLTEAVDGLVLAEDQVVVKRGYAHQGQTYYYDGIEYILGQQKITVNQPPLFDVFDKNGVSFGNSDVYQGTSFQGCKLFSYGIGDGIDDNILGFPIRYSNIDNVGDISFDVSFNLDTFNYVLENVAPITLKVNTGYVYNYTGRETYVRELGWQTAVGNSGQYQAFEFPYTANSPPTLLENGNTIPVVCKCDVAALPTELVLWPSFQVYNNNTLLVEGEDYTVIIDSDSTTFNVQLTKDVDTVIQILVISNQVSKKAYYTIPINLSNNPFNTDVESVNVGDIRGQYQSIFYNNPNTTGAVFGSNNYRDLGNMVPYGNRIIQNSASLVLPAAFLRSPEQNLDNAIIYNAREYIKFKTLLIDVVSRYEYTRNDTPAFMLDTALEEITSFKNQEQSFFWSDMIPSKSVFATNTYYFNNNTSQSTFGLTRIYDFSKANYNGVLVYVNSVIDNVNVTKQLTKGVDYTVSTTAPSLTITYDLQQGDSVTINEYNQTYGSYVPNTPTKLGLYPSFIPQVVLDTGYYIPTYFIKGHDGSYTKLYGDYDPETGLLSDFRDQVTLEFELRVYNNLKLSTTIPIRDYEIIPGFFRDSDYSYDEFLRMYSPIFLDWIGQNRLNYKRNFYVSNNQFSYNYRDSGNKLNGQPIQQGYWRGLYSYMFDTTMPGSTPWEMIGYTNKPTWWDDRYGMAPYTSDNLILWQDMAAGYDYNGGNPKIIPEFIRPELLQVLPVDSQGNVVNPLNTVVGSYTSKTFNREWIVGDDSPVEFSYRRSSSWPYDLMRLLAITKPAKFYNLGVDLDNYKYNEEFNQWLVDDRRHLVISDIQIYGNGTPKTSYINWIVDYQKQVGLNATKKTEELLFNLDVRLVYRLAGFSDKALLKFYVEKGTPNNNNASLLIPDESYAALLYENQPSERLVYTGIVVQKLQNGWGVFGNSQTNAYFSTRKPVLNGQVDRVTVENLTVSVAQDYSDNVEFVPYGTVYGSVQEVSQFIMNYGKWTESQGAVYDYNKDAITYDWKQMVAEFLYWAQLGWEDSSLVNLNPSAQRLMLDRPGFVVQPLTIQKNNFILNQNLYPIKLQDLSIVRDNSAFIVETQNKGDTIAYGQFNFSAFETGIVFDNMTLFDDVIYNLVTGLRQQRIKLFGTKTAEWTGVVNASGFILNQDNIEEWKKEYNYTKGSIVLYKNRYWTALKIVQAGREFSELDWKETDYNEIQKGLLPNSSTRSYESALYYNIDKANLELDADQLSFSLIGFRPRDYLAFADLTDITQVNVYKNLIKNKGTRNALSAFKGAQLPQGGIDYEVYENWAIKSATFGGVLNQDFVEFRLKQSALTGNPGTVALTNGVYTDGIQQEVPIYSLFNYGRPVTDPNVLSTIPASSNSELYPNAGYVNFNDVKMSSYFIATLSNAVDKNNIVVPLNRVYMNDYVWVANYLGTWQVFSPQVIGRVVNVIMNLNQNAATVVFDGPHGLNRYQPFGIVNFSPLVDGYYIAQQIISPNSVLVSLSFNLTNNVNNLRGLGIGFKFQTARVDTAASIPALPLLDKEFTKNLVWVDEGSDGGWAVYRKSLNYQYEKEFTKTDSESYGSAVAYDSLAGYLISDADLGELYRYTFSDLYQEYQLTETITNEQSFGSSIAHAENLYVISQPTIDPRVYIYTINDVPTTDELLLLQEIEKPVAVTGEWGSTVTISGDTNWIYVSAKDDRKVYVYQKQNIPYNTGYFTPGQIYQITNVGDTNFISLGADDNREGVYFIANNAGDTANTGTALLVTYKLADIIDMSGTLAAGDDFGKAVATDYYSTVVTIGAPNVDFDVNTQNTGKTFAYQRTVQSFDVQTASIPNNPSAYPLIWTPSTTTLSLSSSNVAGPNYVTFSSSIASLNIDDAIVFRGAGLTDTGIIANQVYYVNTIDLGTNSITIKTSRSSNTAATLLTKVAIATSTGTVQTDRFYVTKNGIPVYDDSYFVIGSTFNYTGTLAAGDIITISSKNFVYVQELLSPTNPRVGVQFGYAAASNQFGSELLVGAPFALNSINQEGAVYRYTNAGVKYGTIYADTETNITVSRQILLNGYLVTLPVGGAETAVNAINGASIPNIQAAVINDKIAISLINPALALVNNKLSLSVTNITTLNELGITLYTNTQTITCPHLTGPTQFGSTIKFNEADSIVVSAPVGNRYAQSLFDFTDDINLDNDTVFDNNATQFVDAFEYAGAVYMFDYIPIYEENINNVGQFVYAQSVNAQNLEYGLQPKYGTALDFNENRVVIGTPGFRPDITDGQVITYVNNLGLQDWEIYRSSAPVVDISKIQNSQIFSASTNNTLVNLDYIDPLQGKIFGAVRQNIDYVSNNDPAGYVSIATTGAAWGDQNVGQMWFNTSNVRFVNYHQNDAVYNAKYWGTVFPGSDVAVYTWISSTELPSAYTGPGIPFDVERYSIQGIVDNTGTVVPVYYYWVRNTNIIFSERGKTLADSVVADYIINPVGSGISYMVPLLPNAFALYNSQSYINANDSVFHVGYSTGSSNAESHEEFTLVRTDFATDFLPGIPTDLNSEPTSLYDRMLDSLCGVDEVGQVVPNPWLPKAVQSGILARPRQSFFYNRFLALKNYLGFANDILAQFPIRELRPNATYLAKFGTYYDTRDYWQYVNWWSPGYDNSTRASVKVPLYNDLTKLNVNVGTIASVAKNSDGFSEWYIYEGNTVWRRIGLENGTIEFSSILWDYAEGRLGFGDNFFDTDTYDNYPSEPTRWIVRALNEQIYTNELLIFRNKSLITLFEYIQAETTESQNYLPWLNKTSLVDVSHKIRELVPLEVFQNDNTDFLQGYLMEVKPYHVVIKDYLLRYTGREIYQGNITDFDLPAQYDTSILQFVTPQLVYSNDNSAYTFLPSSDIWNDLNYTQWYNNYGVSLTGQENYPITLLSSYLTLSSNFMIVENSQGFPINGVIKIYDPSDTTQTRFELISYATVDRTLNVLSGLTRGYNNTPIYDHLPGQQIYIDLPAVVVLDGGSQYSSPPKVTAFIDPTLYPAETIQAIVPAQLEAVMALDTIIGINVLDPGKGYPQLPEILIEPAFTIIFKTSDVNNITNTIVLSSSTLQTGNLLRYRIGADGVNIGGLINNQWYYINVLERTPNTVIALYTTLADALSDTNRVRIYTQGSGVDHSLSFGGKASAVSSAQPVRENNITLRFDRTTYRSQVTDWKPGVFYGSFFAGSYQNTERMASSRIQLQDTRPNIKTILASSQGVIFNINEVVSIPESITINDSIGVEWSSFIRYVASTSSTNNAITLLYDSTEPNASGSTIGFTPGMPIKLNGAVVGGLNFDTVYYIYEVLNESDFTITDDPTLSSGPLALTTATVPSAGLKLYTATITPMVTINVNYPGIRTVTATSAVTNTITIPVNTIGTGGTQGMYTDMPVFFTKTGAIGPQKFGNIRTNQTYYVVSVIDNQTFTISENPNPLTLTLLGTTSVGNILTILNTSGLQFNTPIVFNDFVINGIDVDTFGNIEQGKIYYVAEVINGEQITISDTISGLVYNVTDVGQNDSTYGTIISQANVLPLTNETGTLTVEMSLPISPGQVDGQLFTFYETSGQYPNIDNGSIGNLITRTIAATLTDVNKVVILDNDDSDGTDNFYVNMPFNVDDTIGVDPLIPGSGLIAGTTYYVKEIGVLETEVYATTADNRLLTNDTSNLYNNAPIVFSGTSLGGVVITGQYYVMPGSIVPNVSFKIISQIGDTEIDLTSSSGNMLATGMPYIVATATQGSSTEVDLGSQILETTLNQEFDAGDLPVFDISYVLGGYRVIIENSGSGFALNNTITISGNQIGGVSPENDLVIEVNAVTSTGAITNVICNGTPAGKISQFYGKVTGANEFALFTNKQCTIPASINNFPYVGVTSTNALAISSNVITVADASGFDVNDEVVFTGNVYGDLDVGTSYYILTILGNNITLTNEPGGSTLTLTNGLGSMLMTKAGSFALLPEPFYFTQSIVKYNNRVYQCVISNNDSEFVFGKWELLDSDNRKLNALDRIVGYYQPTLNMPGLDLTQLVSGITDPNPTYLGNPFQPNEQMTIDTILKDNNFYPREIDLTGIVFNGRRYIYPANSPKFSAFATNVDEVNYHVIPISKDPIGLTDMYYNNSYYIATSTNKATPIIRSSDAASWTTAGKFIPNGLTILSAISLASAGVELEAITYHNGLWVAVGSTILISTNSTVWTQVLVFPTNLNQRLYDVSYVTTPSFTGFVAVGKGERRVEISGVPINLPTNLIYYSTNGSNWVQAPSYTPLGLNSVTSNGSVIIAVGEDGIIYQSTNPDFWTGINEVTVTLTKGGSDQEIVVASTAGFNVGDSIRFTNNFDIIKNNVTYTVTDIVSDNFIKINSNVAADDMIIGTSYCIVNLGDTDWNLVAGTSGAVYNVNDIITVAAIDAGSTGLGGLTGAGSVPSETRMYLYPRTATLNNVSYENNRFIAVGNEGLIRTSTNAIDWITQASGTISDLNASNYYIYDAVYTVVGKDSTVIMSTDNGISWTSTSVFHLNEPDYNVTGAPFNFGYGPEELVPGVVTDNLAMVVHTRAGTNWPVTEYGHVGYNVVSLESTPSSMFQTDYKFIVAETTTGERDVDVPVALSVYKIDDATGLATAMYAGIDYNVDWINDIVILNNPLPYPPVGQYSLRIDIYEVGNGLQLAKSNSKVDPIRPNSTTGFKEIYLDVLYSAPTYEGGGVVQPESDPITVNVLGTEAITNRVYVQSVDNFVLNSAVRFTGLTYGNIQENVTYYVKSISTISKTITLSQLLVSGIAGPTFSLTTGPGTGEGPMFAVIQIGSGLVWTDPVVYANGNRLVFGQTGTVYRTRATNSSVVCNDTSLLYVNQPIRFSSSVNFGGLTPLTTYYIQSIINSSEFRISNTIGGAPITLTNGAGGGSYLTNDYAIGLQDDNISSKIIFATNYDDNVDYIAFSVLGQTTPEQYDYTVPQTQTFIADGMVSQFTLDNYVGGTNPENAIVEINGLRQTIDNYNIDSETQEISFTIAPSANSIVAVTTYNSTARQYLNTQYDAGVNALVANILNINNVIKPVLDVSPVTATQSGTNYITVTDTTLFVVGQTAIFKAPKTDAGDLIPTLSYRIESLGDTDWNYVANTTGITYQVGDIVTCVAADFGTTGQGLLTEFGGLDLLGTVYFVNSIVNGSQFTVKDEDNNIVVLNNATGFIIVEIGGQPAVRVTTGIINDFSENMLVQIDDVKGTTQLNNNKYYVKIINKNTFDLYTKPYDPAYAVQNYPVEDVSSYISGGYAWRAGMFTVHETNAIQTFSNNTISVDDSKMLVIDTPIYFNDNETNIGDTLMGGIICGETYYIKEIDFDTNKIKISETRGGDPVVLSDDTGLITVSQWEQDVVDRLWVTVNGYRIPSSRLRLNPNNELSILVTIEPGDEVIITSMIPSSSPDTDTYINFVDAEGNGKVYRANNRSTTYLTRDLNDIDNEIFLHDVENVTRRIDQTSITPSTTVDGHYRIGLNAKNKEAITYISVYNKTRDIIISPQQYELIIVSTAPQLEIRANSNWISSGDELEITILEGNILFINGEQIKFLSADLETNTVTHLQRGANGTGMQLNIPKYSKVFGIIPTNLMKATDYNKTWNSNIYNTVDGDPLQISLTESADFLKSNRT